ncbi:MAG: hypothetical protein FWF38_00515 [Spirochaetaceae bacterium]|nr:hypothetical protein [Spirochaetaceae bacterium]
MNITIPVNRFTSGEISPKLAALINTEIYDSSLRTLENFVVTNQGTLRRRPGSYFLSETSGNYTVVFHEFRSTSGEYFMLEFTAVFVRFRKEDGDLLRDSSDIPIGFPVPYQEHELKELRVAVADNAIWIAHRNHTVRKITYTPGSPGSFVLSEPTFTGGRTFNAVGDYPGVICFYAGRLFLASTTNEPSAIFASRPYDSTTGNPRYTDFDFGSANPQANDAIMLQEKDLLGSNLLWLLPQRRLIAATTKTTWMSDDNPPMPDTFDMNVQSFNGSADIQARLADNIVAYVGRDNVSLRICAFSNEAGGLIDRNISKAAEHILKKGIVSIAVQTIPETVIWVSLKDGTFASCLIDIEEGIIAWSRHSMQNGFVEHLNVLAKADGDDLYLCVRRYIKGTPKRYVEVIHLSELELEKEEEHFIDCGIRLVGKEGYEIISGLNFLDGETLSYLSNGAVKAPVAVTSGITTVKIDKDNSVVHIGLPIESRILFKHLETPANGTSQGKNKKIEKVTLRVYESRGGHMGQFLNKLRPLLYERYGEIIFGDTPNPFTGDVEIDFQGTTDKKPDMWIVTAEPVNFHLLGAFIKVNICEV